MTEQTAVRQPGLDRRRPTGMAAFTTLWAGQMISATGTRMTQFALSIWVWEQTRQTSALAAMAFLAYGATVLASPFAGAIIDRWHRRVVLVLSDVASALVTLVVLVLFFTGTAQVWHLLVANAVTGAFLAFQGPAYSSTISILLSKERFPRANAMMSLARSVPGIFGPMLGAALLAFMSVSAVLAVDAVSYVFAFAAVLLVSLPALVRDQKQARPGLWKDSVFGFRYIAARPGLLGLQVIHVTLGMLAAMGWIALTPLIMTRGAGPVDSQELQVGIVNALGAVGGVLGGIAVAVAKAPKRKIVWFFLAVIVFSVFGRIALGLGDSVVIWAAAWFCAWMCLPVIDAYNQAIWQEKVDVAEQGRVLAARQSLVQLSMPVAMVISGPLVDKVFEPQMAPGGALTPVFGGLVGSGPGAGMALMFVLTGAVGVVIAVIGYLIGPIRRVEEDGDVG